jgi:hypothetical protein
MKVRRILMLLRTTAREEETQKIIVAPATILAFGGVGRTMFALVLLARG